MFTDLNSELFSWIRGGFFILAIYHLLIFFQNGKNIYLFYCYYLLAFFAFFATYFFPYELKSRFLGYFPLPIYFLTYSAFFAFSREILETKTRTPKWDKYFNFATIFPLSFAVLFVILQVLLGSNYQILFIKIVSPVVTVLMILAAFVALQTKLPSSRYYFLGTIIYVVLSSISQILVVTGELQFFEIDTTPILFIYIGALIEAMIFAYIIGLSVKRIELQNKSAEIKLAFKYKELEELKMTALQSQMNPHFLFNSLNSINNFVLKSDVEKASDYITKFSRLIRVILKSSTSTTVPFSEELGTLSLYVKLEQMRINGGFEYVVNIDDAIRLDEIQVPPLFLQPFIENSIWHGLTHVEGDKKITLTLRKEDDNIICEIVDNGIGINKAREQSHKKIDRRKFFGTKATENRIKLLYKKTNVEIKFIDISDEKSTGTMVRIIFPHILAD